MGRGGGRANPWLLNKTKLYQTYFETEDQRFDNERHSLYCFTTMYIRENDIGGGGQQDDYKLKLFLENP